MTALTIDTPARCRIAGTGAYLPGPPISNREVVERLGATGPRGARDADAMDALIFERLGVANRHWVHAVGEPFRDDAPSTVDLGARALEQALNDAALSSGALGAIITSTSTPARITGANAPAIAGRVGARCAAFDVRAGCTGGLLAFVQGCLFATSTRQPVAVVGADAFSLMIPPDAPLAALALGDGAGAVVIVPHDRGGLRASTFDADGSIDAMGGGAPFPCTHDRIDAGAYWLRAAPEAFLEQGTLRCADAASTAMESATIGVEDIACFIPQQSSRPAIERMSAALGVAHDCTFDGVADHGNCGAAGLFLALHHRRPLFRADEHLLLGAVGGGLTWGAAIYSVGGIHV
ncbi:MAG: 3-oxoacyl-[acyl-carrier-protein] synthase III C-terminal domain-containing protein [Deltaproteobacteria bacterium]|jgi:3-oxoacyl-[acyl-carrier-protein] synthase III